MVTGTTFAPYFPFVLIAALLLGWRAAAVVMIGSAVVANFLFMEPRHTLFARPDDTLGAVFFVISSSLLIAVADTLRRTAMAVQRGVEREANLNADLRHLNSELQHRVKNILTVVQGLAAQTFRGAPAYDQVVRTFRGRLHALAEAQDVLTSGRWESCQLPDLALRALAPFNEHGALNIDGPICSLPEPACVPLVLALHELGTNAVKYGALSSLTGSVDLIWTSVETPNGSRQVVLKWAEKDGPKVAPPQATGLDRGCSRRNGASTMWRSISGPTAFNAGSFLTNRKGALRAAAYGPADERRSRPQPPVHPKEISLKI